MSGSVQRQRINGKLTDPFPVTSGTPEGSINSPEVFAITYTALLEELDIHEIPDDLSTIERGKVYYIIFADDLSFFLLDIPPLEERTNEFKDSGEAYDMAMNAGKSKWMAFLPPDPEKASIVPDRGTWRIRVGGELVENVDEFHYLGFRLDCFLSDDAHIKLINERYLRAAQVTGKLMNDLRCVNLINMRRFFLSLVFSQLYGLIFVDESKIEFDRGVGIFLKASLGLPLTFPHVVACALLGIKHVSVFQVEQRAKFMLRWETHGKFPVFDMFFTDRAFLFPCSLGLNARMGQVLVQCGLSRTLDYREHYKSIVTAVTNKRETEHRRALLMAEGRALWTELCPDGFVKPELKIVLSNLTHENLRNIVLLFADQLCWCALKVQTRSCPNCHEKFTTAHFFSCSRFFVQESGWRIFVGLCRTELWEDLVDFSFEILTKWVTEMNVFRPNFRLNVLEYRNLCRDPVHASFRWNV